MIDLPDELREALHTVTLYEAARMWAVVEKVHGMQG